MQNWKRRLLSALLSAVMVLMLPPASAWAANVSGEAPMQDREFVPGVVPEVGEYAYPTVEQVANVFASDLFALPTKYDARAYQTPVKDQSGNGLCWAFSSIGALEANLKKNGMGDQNFSELHMGYATSAYAYNGETVNANQCNIYNTTLQNTIVNGGNRECAAWYMTRATGMSGLVSEEEDPYVDLVQTFRDPAITESRHKDMYARDILFLTDDKDRAKDEIIKSAVKAYGGVQASLYWKSGDDWCNGKTGAYCYSGDEEGTNHAVMVVGWDDNYDRENFKESCRPESNGAWLMRNSHGTDGGLNGYYWVSYEDKFFPSHTAAYVGADGWQKTNHVYESDYRSSNSVNFNNYSNSAEYVKSYPIESPNHRVASVRVFLPRGGELLVEADVIPSFTADAIDSYSFSAKGSRSVAYPGWYTIDLDTPVRLASSGTFAVAVRVSGTDNSIGYDKSNALPEDVGVWMKPVGNYAFGSQDRNLAIKAVAEDVRAKYTVTFQTNGGSTIPARTTVSGTPVANFWNWEPVRDGYVFRGWYTDAACTTLYDFSSPVMKNLTLYAGWEENSVAWSLSGGTLTVSGVGPMEDYVNGGAPWYAQRNSIQRIVVGEGVTHIGAAAFYGCGNAASVQLPSTLKTIGPNAFGYCQKYSSITIPNGVTRIGNFAFMGNGGLTSISLPSSLNYVGRYAFYYSSSLGSVEYGGAAAQWDEIVICDNNENLTSAARHCSTYGVFGGLSGDALTASVTAPAGAKLIAASYDARGKMLSVKAIPINKACTGKAIATGLERWSGRTYRVMLVDGEFRPLCQFWSENT